MVAYLILKIASCTPSLVSYGYSEVAKSPITDSPYEVPESPRHIKLKGLIKVVYPYPGAKQQPYLTQLFKEEIYV